jgi:tight adherence protein C
VSSQFLIAITLGIVCGVVIAAYFVAIDRTKPVAATNGAWTVPPVRTPWIKQFEALARPLASRMPTHETAPLRQKLSRAGDPGGLTPAGFHAVRYAAAALFAIVGLTIGLFVNAPIPSLLLAPLSGAAAAFLGYMTPRLWLEQRISQRRHQIERSLAEATDLLTLVVESGMSLDEGLLSITERFHNALGDEIGKVLREIRLGRPRMVALEHMAETTGVADLHHLVESIVQSDQMGVPIARLLRVQAMEMRRRQRQTAQERAAQASSRMVFPMVGCIFPVLWIVLLGPAIIQILKSLH